MLKSLYFHKQQKNKTFLSKKGCFSGLSTLPSDGNGERLNTEHSHWLIFKYKQKKITRGEERYYNMK